MVDIVPVYGVQRDSGLGAIIQAGTPAYNATTLSGTAYAQGVDAYGNGIVMTEGTKPTFSAVSIGLVPAAAATDIFQIGSTTRTVRVLRIEVSGTATTAIATPLVLVRRPSAATGGTAATGTALPSAMTHDSSLNFTGTAALNAWTANPTPGTAVGYVRTASIALPLAATGTMTPVIWDFTTRNGQGIVLRAGQYLALNLNGATVAGGLLYIDIEFSEE